MSKLQGRLPGARSVGSPTGDWKPLLQLTAGSVNSEKHPFPYYVSELQFGRQLHRDAVRRLDLSNRPWDTGWALPARPLPARAHGGSAGR